MCVANGKESKVGNMYVYPLPLSRERADTPVH